MFVVCGMFDAIDLFVTKGFCKLETMYDYDFY